MTVHWLDTDPGDPNRIEWWVLVVVIILMGWVLFEVGREIL